VFIVPRSRICAITMQVCDLSIEGGLEVTFEPGGPR
jgi:hypothetical protein